MCPRFRSAHAALELVLRDDVALDLDAGRNDVRQHLFGDGAFERREKAVGPERRIFDDFGPAAGHFRFGQSLEAARGADREHGLMKGAHEVFAALEIDGCSRHGRGAVSERGVCRHHEG